MDKYAELRAALAAGPTPGPWGVQSSNSWRRIGTPRGDGNVLSPTLQADGHPDLSARPETLAYIAACHPETIRALLAERDALRDALDTARDFVAEALAKERVAYRGHDSVSNIADIERYLAQIDAALAQGEANAE